MTNLHFRTVEMATVEESSETPERVLVREVVIAACELHLRPVADALLEMREDGPSVQQLATQVAEALLNDEAFIEAVGVFAEHRPDP